MKRPALLLSLLLLTQPAIPADKRGLVRPAASENRVALVIGNKDYPGGALKNPINDASDIKAALEKLGFTVVYRENADLAEMDAAMHEFIGKLGQGGVGLFYFAGHGMQAGDTNYLLPVGVPIASKAELKSRGYDARIALDSMEEAKARVSVVILDACRTAPLRGASGGRVDHRLRHRAEANRRRRQWPQRHVHEASVGAHRRTRPHRTASPGKDPNRCRRGNPRHAAAMDQPRAAAWAVLLCRL